MNHLTINKTYIECECGTHVLQVQSEIELFPDGEKTRFRQEYWLAMFGYRQEKRSIWGRIIIAYKYLRTGEMHLDQIILSNEEATKLVEFIRVNMFDGEKTN